MQKPNVEAEFYDNKKFDWKKNRKAQKLNWISFANKVNNWKRGGNGKEKVIQTNLQNKSKNKNNKCFYWVTAVRILSLTGRHSSPHLPRMLSNTVLISGPAVEVAQILIWSYFYVFLPPMSTAIRVSAFSFVGALNDLLYSPLNWSLLSWSCGFNLQLIQLVGRFWVFFLRRTAPGF